MPKRYLLQLLNESGVGRNLAETRHLISKGIVTIDGRVCTRPDFQVDPQERKILVSGKPLLVQEKVYFLLNKPKGYSCQKNERFPYVGKLIPKYNAPPVGRLDVNTTGLLIMTNDGKLSKFITEPRHHIPKTYRVTVDNDVQKKDLVALREGVVILVMEKDYLTRPATVKSLSRRTLEITITEGKKRQIRLMLAALGYTVTELQRIKIGNIALGHLKEGEYQRVSKEFIRNRL